VEKFLLLDLDFQSHFGMGNKRPYVHFLMTFCRQNCDHMCIINSPLYPLPR
uniref:Uncharacterized protein n=1 Tax=Callorhinchus milii TaxID=7868 RepID=A0A4W3J2F9_CALMI